MTRVVQSVQKAVEDAAESVFGIPSSMPQRVAAPDLPSLTIFREDLEEFENSCREHDTSAVLWWNPPAEANGSETADVAATLKRNAMKVFSLDGPHALSPATRNNRDELAALSPEPTSPASPPPDFIQSPDFALKSSSKLAERRRQQLTPHNTRRATFEKKSPDKPVSLSSSWPLMNWWPLRGLGCYRPETRQRRASSG
jgi:hypothetical protein